MVNVFTHIYIHTDKDTDTHTHTNTHISEEYKKPSHISKFELFLKIINYVQPLVILKKKSQS